MDERKPWDQLPNEPDRAYARFLVYLHLGPSRSILAAVKASKGDERRNGQWGRDSSNYDWQSRATLYDIQVLAPKLGKEVVINWSIAAQEMSKQLVQEILGGKLRPRNFSEVIDLFNVLSNLVTPETLEAVKQSVSGYFDAGEGEGGNK